MSEDSILKWYKGAHSSKGKSVFLEQMKSFVEWLENAEEGMHGSLIQAIQLEFKSIVLMELLLHQSPHKL